VAELIDLPPQEWLIEDIVETGVFAAVYGESGDGKSFVTIDWALSVATGLPWLGKGVKQGPTVYVAAEGGRSIGRRVKAWMVARNCPAIPDAFFVLESVHVRDEKDVRLLCKQIDALSVRPILIVIDTLARCSVGGDENSALDMGLFVAGIDEIRNRTGASVVVVHHTGKNSKTERGSSALRSATDVMVRVSKTGSVVTIANNKQKDDEDCDDIRARLEQVSLSVAGSAEPVTSCVLAPTPGKAATATDTLPTHLRGTLGALSPGVVMSTADWKKAVGLGDRIPQPPGQFASRQIRRTGQEGLVPAHSERSAGAERYTADCNCNRTASCMKLPSPTAATATTPVGGGNAWGVMKRNNQHVWPPRRWSQGDKKCLQTYSDCCRGGRAKNLRRSTPWRLSAQSAVPSIS
jgi:hypothetical protein